MIYFADDEIGGCDDFRLGHPAMLSDFVIHYEHLTECNVVKL
jgi:hypothetical protein